MPPARKTQRRTRRGWPSALCATDPNRVLAVLVRAPVEPAVARLDLEALVDKERAPLVRVEPREPHRRLRVFVSNRERERASLLVPVGALEDPGLALEPASVGVFDVAARRREDVEDEAAAGGEQPLRGAQGEPAVLLRVQVQQRPERTKHERHALPHGRLAQVAYAKVEQRADAGERRTLRANVEHPP